MLCAGGKLFLFIIGLNLINFLQVTLLFLQKITSKLLWILAWSFAKDYFYFQLMILNVLI